VAATKMHMLMASIAEPPVLDTYNLPVSKYRQTRLKSTKDLVHTHKLRASQGEQYSPIYANTSNNASPVKNSPSKPQQTTFKMNAVASFVNTPAKQNCSTSRSRSRTSRDEDPYDESSPVKQFDQDRYNVYHSLKMGYVSPMKGVEEEYLIERIKEWMKLENFIDNIKEELILYCEDFGPVQAFRIFVQKPDKGRNITIHNLNDAWELLNVPLSEEESQLLMNRFDSNRDGVLTYTDICDVFRPRNPALSKEFGQRMPMELQTS
jgi:EF-hand domain pair